MRKSFKIIWVLILLALPGELRGGYEILEIGGVSARAVSGEVILKFRSGVPAGVKAEALSGAGARVISRQSVLGIKLVVSDTKGTESLVRYFRSLDEVEYAVPNYVVTASSYRLPGDFSSLAELRQRQWGLERINAPGAWDITTGEDVLVAVLDTGIDIDHEKLRNNIWVNPDPLSPLDFGDGYIVVNDTHGWNFIDNTNNISTSGVHGTHVAGIIAGEEVSTSSPASGFVGVNWNADIMAVEVLCSSTGSGDSWALVSGILYALRRGADIINMSLGYAPGHERISPVEEACEYAYSRGVLLVSSSGNIDGSPGYGGGIGQPASYRSVIAVGATDSEDRKAVFSNYGEELEISAPGVDIYSTLPGGTYGEKSGTSMAAPFVSGIASMVISVWRDRGLDWTPGQARQVLTASAETPAGGKDRMLGYGYSDLLSAVRTASESQGKVEEKRLLVYPNPFYPEEGQEVKIVLPARKEAGARRLRIYTLDGVSVLERDVRNLPVTWDGRNSEGRRCASGLYFFYLETEDGSETGRITLIR